MGEDSKIEWTDHTFNPWWGCQRVSPGCENCYAEELDARYFAGKENWGPRAPRRFFADKHWNQPLRWNRQAEEAGVRARVFCASMADWAEDRPDLAEPRARLFRLIRATPNLDWLLLTKREDNIARFLPWAPGQPCAWDAKGHPTHVFVGWGEPWPNVWPGVTAEDQKRANERLPKLLAARAVKRFVSYEPALELVDFRAFVPDGDPENRAWCLRNGGCEYGIEESTPISDADACLTCGTLRGDWKTLLEPDGSPRLSWLIAGSESGREARPAQLDWYRDVRDQVVGAGVNYFVKQHAIKGKKLSLPVIDGRQWTEIPS